MTSLRPLFASLLLISTMLAPMTVYGSKLTQSMFDRIAAAIGEGDSWAKIAKANNVKVEVVQDVNAALSLGRKSPTTPTAKAAKSKSREPATWGEFLDQQTWKEIPTKDIKSGKNSEWLGLLHPYKQKTPFTAKCCQNWEVMEDGEKRLRYIIETTGVRKKRRSGDAYAKFIIDPEKPAFTRATRQFIITPDDSIVDISRVRKRDRVGADMGTRELKPAQHQQAIKYLQELLDE